MVNLKYNVGIKLLTFLSKTSDRCRLNNLVDYVTFFNDWKGGCVGAVRTAKRALEKQNVCKTMTFYPYLPARKVMVISFDLIYVKSDFNPKK